MKSEEFHNEFNNISFLDTLIQGSIRTIKKGQNDLNKLYEGYKKLLENQIKSTPEKEEECKKLLEILEKTYKIFSDQEMTDIIIKNNITHKQFISKYGEKILGEELLGDNNRKYDISDKFNPNLIAYEDKEKQTRKVEFVPRKGVEHVYIDNIGKQVSIQEIGKLYFKEWNGLNSDISKYRVMKQIEKNNYEIYEVFSNIKIIMMENPEYRAAVLDELLSKKNIQLSKAGGYVGEIVDAIKTNNDNKMNNGKSTKNDEYYLINSKYAIAYHLEEIAATMIYEMNQKNNNKINIDTIDKDVENNKEIQNDSNSNSTIIYKKIKEEGR